MDLSVDQGALTLREILEFPTVRRAVPEVVACQERIDQVIRWVHPGDVSYIATMLKGGELLLTTGLGIGNGGVEQRHFIADLSRRGVVAAAVELGARFKKQLPAALVEEAKRHGLVLIAFHREIPFVEITEAVHAEIVSRQVGLLRRSEELHQRFFGLVLDGSGTPEILAALAEMTSGPVFLERSGHGVIYHDSGEKRESEALADWDAFSHGLAQAPVALERPVPLGQDAHWGRLVALFPSRDIEPGDGIAVERAVEVIALALLRDREEENIRDRERGNFLTGLLRGDFDEATARARAADLGMRPSKFLVPMIATHSPRTGSLPGGGSLAAGTAAWVRVWGDSQREARDRAANLVAGTREHEREMICVIGVDEEGARNHAAGLVADAVHTACHRRLADPDAAVVCVGAAVSDWTATAGALRALTEVTPLAANLPPQPWHDMAAPSLDRLLWVLRDDEELARFTQTRLGPLLKHDEHRGTNLAETLESYCRHVGRKAETARDLNIERQSLYHRIHRIEEILRVDLGNGEILTELHFALRVRRTRAGK